MAKFSPDSPCFNKGCQGNLQGDSRKVNVNWLNKLGFLEEQMSDLLGKPLCENCNLFGFNMWKQGFTAIAGGCSLKRRRQAKAFVSKRARVDTEDHEDHRSSILLPLPALRRALTKVDTTRASELNSNKTEKLCLIGEPHALLDHFVPRNQRTGILQLHTECEKSRRTPCKRSSLSDRGFRRFSGSPSTQTSLVKCTSRPESPQYCRPARQPRNQLER